MEVTTAERYASGGPGKELHAQNLALAFQATVDRLGDDPAIVWTEGDDVESSWNELARRVQPDRRRPRRARRRQGRHGRADAQQPARVHPARPRRRLARRACRSRSTRPPRPSRSPTSCSRRRRQGRDRRDGVPRGLRRGAQGPARDRDRDRRSTATGGDHTLDELEAIDPDFDPSRVDRRGRARRPADADLHLGHDRAAEGRAAHPPQPDDADLRASRTSSSSPSAAAR